MSANVKVLETWKLSDFEFHVKIKYKGKEYSDNFSVPGYEKLIKELDSKSDQYKIINAMLNATKRNSFKTVGGLDVSKNNQE